MARIQSYSQLIAWQRGMDLVEECYRLSARLSERERFGLVQQLRRAAVSIPSNIAEGFNRRSRRAYVNHLSIAVGSQAEVATQLELVERLGLLPVEETTKARGLAAEVGRLLHGLIRALQVTES